MSTQHHASLGRRTLEEIRQKRAAERLSKASSGSDLSTTSYTTDTVGIRKSESGTRLSENDIGSLVAQLKDLQKKNTDLEEENKKLSSKLQKKETECDTQQRRLNDLEQNVVPSLRKALRDVAMEKDAAVVAREDLSAQLRTIKKRLKEAEEEQYRAEEDAAALRAELNTIQQQAMNNNFGSVVVPIGGSSDHALALEKELVNLKSELQRETQMRQQEIQQLAEERARISSLMAEKVGLEERLVEVTRASEVVSATPSQTKTFSLEDKEKLEGQLHDMAVMVERLEGSRQKLLAEIDSQSSEIEKLFEENANLSSEYQESVGVVAHWQNQVKECLKQNEELRSMLDKLRTEQVNVLSSNGDKISNISTEADGMNASEPQYKTEVFSLKAQLVREQSRAEALGAEVMQLSVQLEQARQAYNNLTRLYRPILRNIEHNLIKMKQDTTLIVK